MHNQLSEFDLLGSDPKSRSDPDKSTELPGGHSECEPPDPIPNSEVKPFSADDSVGPPHVKVGHCQALKQNQFPTL